MIPEDLQPLDLDALECENCDETFDPVATRYRCPRCGWRTNCCEGEAQPAPAQAGESDGEKFIRLFDAAVVERPREYAECEWCGDPIAREEGGLWEHALDPGIDEDHAPERADEASFDDLETVSIPHQEPSSLTPAVGARVVDVDVARFL